MKKNKKRRLKTSVKIFVTILVICVLGVAGFTVYDKYLKEDSEISNNENTDNNKEETPKEPEEQHYEASLIAVGDNLIHSSLYKDANRHANGGYLDFNTGKYDFTPMYKYIKEIVSNYDIGYMNQ